MMIACVVAPQKNTQAEAYATKTDATRFSPDSNIANIRLGMKPSEPAAHGVKIFFAERAFDARKYFVLFKAHMIVEKFREARHCFHLDGQILRAQPLEIPHCGANFRVLGEQANDSRILIEPRVACVRRQEHFFLLTKMNDARLVPERDEFFSLPLNSRIAFLSRSFSRAPHLQSLN